jgi:hypothetical protein
MVFQFYTPGCLHLEVFGLHRAEIHDLQKPAFRSRAGEQERDFLYVAA